MNVIFVEPAFPAYQRQFVRGLHAVGATVIGIGERPGDWLDDELKGWMHHYHQIGSVTDVGALHDAVRWVQDKVWVDRLEATIEAHILPTAEVREACGIPGTSRRTAWLCRDKPAMKEALRSAGVPTAASAAVDSLDEAHAFAAAVGYPLIIKPRAAAGRLGHQPGRQRHRAGRGARRSSAPTGSARSRSRSSSRATRASTTRCRSTARAAYDFVCHYYPNVLEAMRTRWISPQFVSTNRVDHAESYGELKEMGHRVNEVLGIGTSATHMEWFYGPKGLRFSEVGCRPAGVGAWDLYAAGNDVDIFTEWARAIVHGDVHAPLSRQYAAGMVALRPTGDGHIQGYSGVEEMQQQYGEWVIDAHLPGAGHPDPAGRGRLHGERVRAAEAPRLRRAARHAQRRR